MSEENKTPPATGTGQTQDQLKAEINRKMDNVSQQVSQLAEANRILLAQLQATKKQEAAKPPTKIEEVWYDQPEKAIELIEERITNKFVESSNRATKQNQVIGQLVSEFPELGDSNHTLTKRAVEIYSSFTEDEKTSPMAYKAAVREAAQELEIMPKSKRKEDFYEDTDNYSVGGGSPAPSRRQARKGTIDPATKEFGELMGVNMDDEKVQERIKAGHNRRRGYGNWA